MKTIPSPLDDYTAEAYDRFPNLLAVVYPTPNGPADTEYAEEFMWNQCQHSKLYVIEVTEPVVGAKEKCEVHTHAMQEGELQTGFTPPEQVALATTNDDPALHRMIELTLLTLWDWNDDESMRKALTMAEMINSWAGAL